jgi:hypothetical protein
VYDTAELRDSKTPRGELPPKIRCPHHSHSAPFSAATSTKEIKNGCVCSSSIKRLRAATAAACGQALAVGQHNTHGAAGAGGRREQLKRHRLAHGRRIQGGVQVTLAAHLKRGSGLGRADLGRGSGLGRAHLGMSNVVTVRPDSFSSSLRAPGGESAANSIDAAFAASA